ncbi:MAG: TetR/AcrR family transcriptional regulator [Flavobacteriales bacterium]|nr:TetR/AcrR family transcriptional regulator [Flavobacteriales bacterium]
MPRYLIEPLPGLALRDTASPMGGRILSEGLALMNEIGLETFTFKKLAEHIGSTEVTVYHYFANKQRLLQYYFQVYWLWLATHCQQEGKGLKDPMQRLQGDIKAICGLWPADSLAGQFNPADLRELVINEGSKSFMHKNVDSDNKLKLFKPYKDLCAHIATEVKACAPRMKQSRSFATTLVEMAHSLEFAMEHLPALTELSEKKERKQLAAFLIDLAERYVAVKGA